MNNVLHIIVITKNLLSVSELTTDNDASVDFFSHGCLGKDKATRAFLLQGKLEEGLYKMEQPQCLKHNSSSACKKNSESCFSVYDDWHRHVGHPSKQTLLKILQSCNVKIEQNDKGTFYEASQLGKSNYLPYK